MTGWEREDEFRGSGRSVSIWQLRDGDPSFQMCLNASRANGWSYPGQGQDAADVLGDDQRGLGARHGHVEQVQLVLWDFTCRAEIMAECNLRARTLLGQSGFIYSSNFGGSPQTD